MRDVARLLTGGAVFSEHEELDEFRFRFLNILLLFNVVSSGFFVGVQLLGFNRVPSIELYTMIGHLAAAVVIRFALQGRRHLYLPLGWLFAVICFWVLIVALVWVPSDELRVLWFYINLPSIYLTLGRAAGVSATGASLACFLGLNRYALAPYSTSAMVTGVLGFLFLSGFFFAYEARLRSFQHRILDANQQLSKLASLDSLTGLLNARTFYAVCDRMIAVAQRENTPFAVLFVDLDHFKKINDTHGHEAGDQVLRAAADCISRTARRSDVAARMGGEEFCLFTPNTPLEGAVVLAEKLRQAIEGTTTLSGEAELHVTASIGVASSRPHHSGIADIQREADQAMYEAKHQGRNRVSCITRTSEACSEPRQLVNP